MTSPPPLSRDQKVALLPGLLLLALQLVMALGSPFVDAAHRQGEHTGTSTEHVIAFESSLPGGAHTPHQCIGDARTECDSDDDHSQCLVCRTLVAPATTASEIGRLASSDETRVGDVLSSTILPTAGQGRRLPPSRAPPQG